jgi:hypothetical protein
MLVVEQFSAGFLQGYLALLIFIFHITPQTLFFNGQRQT